MNYLSNLFIYNSDNIYKFVSLENVAGCYEIAIVKCKYASCSHNQYTHQGYFIHGISMVIYELDTFRYITNIKM